MPYTRPATSPTPDLLVPFFEKAVKSLVNKFREHPYAFYTESDMHCYLYHRLYSGGLVNGLYKTKEGHDTILLHKEFPTNARYIRKDDRTLEESELGRRRGAFDLCIWDPATVSLYNHREQKVLLAAELALNECSKGSVHTINDATKLTGATNAIQYGYVLYFVRDSTQFKQNEDEIMTNLTDAAKRARVVFACVDEASKPKPLYLGDWGKL